MGTIRTGISAAAVAKYLRGPGSLYKDFTSLALPGTLLGETKGGSTFSYGLSFHDVEPDGAMGWVVGHRFIDKIVPTLAVSLLEHSVNHYLYTLPGSDSADQAPTGVQGEYLGVGTATDAPGVAPAGTPSIDESTLDVFRTPTALGLSVKLTLASDYNIVERVRTVSVENADTITITGSDGVALTYTAAAAEDLTAREFDYDASDGATAISLAACVNDATYGVPGVNATVIDTNYVTFSRFTAGTQLVITESTTLARLKLVFQVVLSTAGGAVLNDDYITVFYVYDATASDDTFTIITPNQIAAADHFTNIALLCEVSDVDQTYPVVFIIKNPLSEPDTIEIPGERINETLLKTTWTGFFDPADGLDLDEAPVELWIPYGI